MFDFLNKLSHNHNQDSPGEEPVVFDEISQSDGEQLDGRALAFEERSSKDGHQKSRLVTSIKRIQRQDKIEKKIERGQSIVGKMQINEKMQLHPNVLAIFKQDKAASEKGSSSYLIDKLREVVAKRERKVYIRQMARDQDQYLQQAEKCIGIKSNYLKQELESTFSNIFNSISFDIETQNIPIYLKRQKYQDSQKEKNQETLKLIRKRQNQLHGKIGQLSVELSFGEQAAEKRALEILNKDQFSPDDFKTKLAEGFVREKQRERQELKTKLQEYKQKKRMAELMSIETNQQQKQRLKRQRHEKITRQFEEKQRLRAQQKQKAKRDEKQFKEFLKQYNQAKPLYQKLQEDFKKREKEEKRQRLAALRQKQAKFEPINLEALQMHQQKYEQLRKQDRQRKQAQLELSRQKERLLKHQLDHNIYKGRFRYIVLQQMVDNQAKKREKQIEKKAILQKKKAFSEQVRQYFQPIVDPSKRMEIEQRINSHRQRKRKYATPNRVAYSDRYSTISTSHPQSEPQVDPQRQGKKYHHIFKQYIRTKIEKGEIKSDQQSSQNVVLVKKAPDYLKELRQKYQGQIPSRSSRLQKQIKKLRQGEDYGSIVLKAQEYDHKAKQQEKKLRNSAHAPSDEARLEQDYLCAIKAKMQLINSIQ